jgi:hypothetical protein
MQADKVVAPFLRGDRLVVMPRRRAARLAVLNVMANRFEPGLKYAEPTVNAILAGFHDDFCSLRRYLVDEGFMDRSDGVYWRAGGTVEVD